MGDTSALEVVVTAPVASFRNPLYAGVQVGLPCPPPSTVGGMLAAAAGSWDRVDPQMRFAMAFHAGGTGVDLETYHPLDATGKKADPTPRERDFLANVTLTVWLVDEIALWFQRLRRPVWPLRLGRSQDIVAVSVCEVDLAQASGRQGGAILPAHTSAAGTRLRLPTAVSLDRSRTRWDDYRFDPTGRAAEAVQEGWCSPSGGAVVLLPASHPAQAAPARV
jgi:CRISPR-associated endonuclease/helicase Cas3/CRISPR-associated protein Cas5t